MLAPSDAPIRWPLFVLIALFTVWMLRSMFESWRRLRAGRRHRLEEAYDIARLGFGVLSAAIILWLLSTPPPHQLTPTLRVALLVWAAAYLGLMGFLMLVLSKRRSRQP